MTPKKQVSPAIRILRGERDASARATHLEAATRKFLVTTNERKQMSTKTNFKRIALVAVTALGMGVLSSAPSQAVFSGTAGSQLTLTATAGSGGLTGSASDSTTASTVTVAGLALTATTDSYTVTAVNKSVPTGAVATPALLFTFIDTATSTSAATVNGRVVGRAADAALGTAGETATTVLVTAGAAAGYVNSKFFAFMDSATARIAGSYVYTVVVAPFSGTAATAGTPQTIDVTYTVAALASASLVASAAFSTVFMNPTTGTQSEAAVSGLATASDTAKGFLNVTLRNGSNDTSARESVTITTTIGTVGDGTVRGRSVVLRYTGATAYSIFSDGTAGVGTITVSTPSVTFASKTVNFYTAAAKTITATVAHPALKVGDNAGAVRGVAVDANGVAWTGTAYIVASSAADALIAGSATTPVSCGTYDSTNSRFNCPVTAITPGTAKFKIIDAATVALATATSNEVTVTVSAAAVSKVVISFDKATYAPNERMRIYVTPQDASGNALPANTYTNLFATGGISANSGFSGSSDTTTAVSVTTVAASSSVTAVKAGAAMYTVYAPAAGGVVTISATGGTSLPTAAQVAVTATATVTDSGAAALAAVTALATTVASLKTLITTLTNLVLKIQKKVKA
jgi:trimeric autotransporter adhesin